MSTTYYFITKVVIYILNCKYFAYFCILNAKMVLFLYFEM